jgi:hypothetical protein
MAKVLVLFQGSPIEAWNTFDEPIAEGSRVWVIPSPRDDGPIKAGDPIIVLVEC